MQIDVPLWIQDHIKNHPEDFEEDKIEELYSKATKLGGPFGCNHLSSFLLGAKLNPLDYCTKTLYPYIMFRQNLINPEVTVNSEIDTIPDYCFTESNIKNLTTNNVIRIKGYAFSDCTELTSITLNKVHDVDRKAFKGCSRLSRVDWEESFQGFVDDESFSLCTSLKTLELPDGVMGIGSKIIANSAVESLYLPDTLEDIRFGSIFKADQLKNVYYGGTMEQWKTINGSWYFRSPTIKIVHCIDGDYKLN